MMRRDITGMDIDEFLMEVDFFINLYKRRNLHSVFWGSGDNDRFVPVNCRCMMIPIVEGKPEP